MSSSKNTINTAVCLLPMQLQKAWSVGTSFKFLVQNLHRAQQGIKDVYPHWSGWIVFHHKFYSWSVPKAWYYQVKNRSKSSAGIGIFHTCKMVSNWWKNINESRTNFHGKMEDLSRVLGNAINICTEREKGIDSRDQSFKFKDHLLFPRISLHDLKVDF